MDYTNTVKHSNYIVCGELSGLLPHHCSPWQLPLSAVIPAEQVGPQQVDLLHFNEIVEGACGSLLTRSGHI